MSSCTATDIEKDTAVGMGQIALGRDSARLRAVLGSCISVALHHLRGRVGTMAHIVLPDSGGRDHAVGKFADTAIPHMIKLLEEAGVNKSGLVAKVAGGARMFGHGGPLQIGEANAEAVRRILAEVGIHIAAEDLGGNSGRRVTLDCSTGNLLVEVVGKPPQNL